MNKPDYISTAAARKMRFVDSIRDVVRENFYSHDVVLFPRRVIGDFAALGRWMDQFFKIEHNKICVEIEMSDLVRLRESMNGGEKYCADQILKDMHEIRNEGTTVKLPKLMVLCHDAVLADMGIDEGEQGILKSCYLGPVVAGFRLTDIWRQARADSVAAELDPCSQRPAADAPPRLVLVGY